MNDPIVNVKGKISGSVADSGIITLSPLSNEMGIQEYSVGKKHIARVTQKLKNDESIRTFYGLSSEIS